MMSCDPWEKRQRTRTGRGPGAGRTIEGEQNRRGPDADRTRAWPFLPGGGGQAKVATKVTGGGGGGHPRFL
eukprot:gene15912-biopygen11260